MKPPARFADLVDLVDANMPAPSIGPAPVMRPLSPRNRTQGRVTRPGALDYRDIPSLHGDVRVPFKSSITTTDEAKQG
jgi:hypothetical protein